MRENWIAGGLSGKMALPVFQDHAALGLFPESGGFSFTRRFL
jgi:hypothetical protein